jgi:FkbM family methyltransferase
MRFIKQIFAGLFSFINSKNQLLHQHEKRSFSQCGEDLIVDFIFNAIGVQFPTYLDIGAHHPYYLNNTILFYLKGCKGINIEPDPSLFLPFIQERKNDINLNIGISDKKDTLDFYIINTPTLNTFAKTEAENYPNQGNFFIKEVKKVNVDTITNILAEFNDGAFPDFLTLDAEGIDELVLKSIDFENNSPTVICIETISFSENGTGVKNYEMIHFLESKGYMLYADTHINSIFVMKDKWMRK